VFVLVASVLLALVLVRRLWLGYPPVGHVALGRGEAAFVTAAAETFFPPDDRLPLDGRAADLPGYVDRYLRVLPPRQRVLIRALFLLFEQATLLFPARGVGAFKRFSSMNAHQRRLYVEGWASSRLVLRRKAFDALKAVLVLGYLGREENLRALGLEPWSIEPVLHPADRRYPPIGRPTSAGPRDAGEAVARPPAGPLRAAAPQPGGAAETP